ncbi:MAG: transcription termination factor Rho [Planctomycetota bacterium]
MRTRKNVQHPRHQGGNQRRRRRGGRGRGRPGAGPSPSPGSAPIIDDNGIPFAFLGETPAPPAPEPGVVFEAPDDAALRHFGVLDLSRDGHGFLRSPDRAYEPSAEDPYVSVDLVRTYGLRDGDIVDGEIGEPRRRGQNPPLVSIRSICGMPPHEYHKTKKWDECTVIDPDRRLELTKNLDEITLRIIDLLAPIGFGQRGLLVSPPRAGKTRILQQLARAVEINHPEAYLIVLLVDERPEEATAMQRATEGEVVVSTNDSTPENHTRITEMVLKKAKRLVETGRDVVILMDSLTRLGRAWNLLARSGGRTLSGGMDSRSLERPKAFFGAARNLEEGGSLTIVATALIETNSKMDTVIFEEFKGTGNMELVLDRKLAEQRVWPAIDISLSGTRKEEKLLPPNQLELIYRLRRVLQKVRPIDAITLLVDRLEQFPDNDKFLGSIDGDGKRSRGEGPFDHGV